MTERPLGPNIDLSQVVKQIGELQLSESSLDEVVSWDARRNAPLTLGDYMRSHAPARALREFGLKRSRKIVRPVNELSEEELKKVVIERLKQMPDNISIAIL